MSAQAGDRQSSTVYDASSIGREKRDDSGAQIWLSERGLVGRHDRALGGLLNSSWPWAARWHVPRPFFKSFVQVTRTTACFSSITARC